MSLGAMLVDYKVMSRDHKRSLRVEDAVVDPELETTCLPLSWLEQLRSPSRRLPTGYYMEEHVNVLQPYAKKATNKVVQSTPSLYRKNKNRVTKAETLSLSTESMSNEINQDEEPNAIRAGPVVLYITGELSPVVLNPYFVPDILLWQQNDLRYISSVNSNRNQCNDVSNDHKFISANTLESKTLPEIDLRLGLDAITQCTLFAELRPGGLLYNKLTHIAPSQRFTPVREVLKQYGMKCGLAESPLVPRPWTRMRYMFIDELQRGPRLTEFVGYNPREGSPWRFSQHTRYFRQGIWLETIRRNEMNDGLHVHSSWQKSPQQSVPEINFLAPYP